MGHKTEKKLKRQLRNAKRDVDNHCLTLDQADILDASKDELLDSKDDQIHILHLYMELQGVLLDGYATKAIKAAEEAEEAVLAALVA